MTTKLLLFGLITLALMLTGCQQQAPVADVAKAPTSQEDLAAIRAKNDSYVKHYNAMDAATLAMEDAEDAIRMPADYPILQGRAAIEEHHRQRFEESKKLYSSATLSLTSEEIEVFGDRALHRGTWTMTATPKSGAAPQVSMGKWMTILKRMPDGSWMGYRNSSNRDHPRLPDPK
jgi:ketosteroid isomerase-like protein